jgi:hypothetical protein
MELERIAQYIEGLCAGAVLSKEEFVASTELKRFSPVIDTTAARFLALLLRLKAPKKFWTLVPVSAMRPPSWRRS